MFRKVPVLVVLAAIGALAVAASAFGAASLTSAANVSVTAGKPAEFRFTLSKKTVPKGTVTFKVTNRGTVKHDFKIAGKKTKSVAPGKAASVSVAFQKAGKYNYLCTLPGHAQGGMKGTITVK